MFLEVPSPSAFVLVAQNIVERGQLMRTILYRIDAAPLRPQFTLPANRFQPKDCLAAYPAQSRGISFIRIFAKM